jgi:hypothetical protein
LPPDPGTRMHMRQGPFGTKWVHNVYSSIVGEYCSENQYWCSTLKQFFQPSQKPPMAVKCFLKK